MRWWAIPLAAVLGLGGASEALAMGSADNGGDFPVAARVAEAPPLDPGDDGWDQARPQELTLYPQRSVPAPLAEADLGKQSAPRKVRVRALHNGEMLALRLSWADPKRNEDRGIGRHADAVAIQWVAGGSDRKRLPYVGMGEPGDPVALWLWRGGDTGQALAAEGFGSLTRQDGDGLKARGEWREGTWHVVLKGPLAAEGEHRLNAGPERGLIPLAVATWRGEQGQRDGRKHLSGWRTLRLEGRPVDSERAERLAREPGAGDPETGKRLMQTKGCNGCHRHPGNADGPTTGPGLFHAGGIHSADYLRRSIARPSAQVVPDEDYYRLQDGQRVSLMPGQDLSETEVRDLMAYLRSLR